MINLQLNLKEIEKLINELNSGVDSLKTEIHALRSKFGDSIIE